MKFILFIWLTFHLVNIDCISSENLTKKSKEILNEGILLYNLERASWISTDLLLEKVNINEMKNFYGYITYKDSNNYVSTYWIKDSVDGLIFSTYTFKDSVDINNVKIDNLIRKPTNYELLLLNIRQIVFHEIGNDTLFKIVEGTRLNFVFTKDSNDNFKVYLLTSTEKEGIIPFGNDYELLFDKKGNLINKQNIHQNFIPIDFTSIKKKEDELIIHTHKDKTSEFITPTDICNILLHCKKDLLYGNYVISEKFVSIFQDYPKPKLIIYDRENFEKIMKMNFDKAK